MNIALLSATIVCKVNHTYLHLTVGWLEIHVKPLERTTSETLFDNGNDHLMIFSVSDPGLMMYFI